MSAELLLKAPIVPDCKIWEMTMIQKDAGRLVKDIHDHLRPVGLSPKEEKLAVLRNVGVLRSVGRLLAQKKYAITMSKLAPHSIQETQNDLLISNQITVRHHGPVCTFLTKPSYQYSQ